MVNQNATMAYRLLLAKGYSPVAASGIVGNLMAESGLDPTIVGDHGTSYGIGQWHGGRAFDLQRQPNWQTLPAQIDYLHKELQGPEHGVYDRLTTAKTPEDAAKAFIGFERPAGWTPENPTGGMAWGKRNNNAYEVYNTLSGEKPMLATTMAGASNPAASTPSAAGVLPAPPDASPGVQDFSPGAQNSSLGAMLQTMLMKARQPAPMAPQQRPVNLANILGGASGNLILGGDNGLT